MSRVFVYLFVFSILSIAVRFGDCDNITPDTKCQDVNITPGSDKTRLSNFEKLSGLKSPLDDLGHIGKRKNKTQSYGSVLEKFKDNVQATYPGTLWCGSGNISRNEENLFKKANACCKQHDMCRNFIFPGETEVNLNNNGIFTRSACSCDMKFYKCLKDSSISGLSEQAVINQIGNTYFNILRPQCFRCVCPTEDCNRIIDTECKDHCMKYEWMNNLKY